MNDGMSRVVADTFAGSDSDFFGGLVETEVEERKYNGRIPFIRRVDDRRPVEMTVDNETRLGIFGQTGSTKTTVAKSLLSRAYKDGYKVAHLSDVKNDFQKINKYGGVSKTLRKKIGEPSLLKGESPTEIPRTLAIPNFMVDYYRSPPDSYATRFSLTMQDVTKEDFKFLLNYAKLSEPQKQTVDILLDRIGDFSYTSIQDLQDVCRDIDEGSTKPVNRALESLKRKKLVSGRTSYSADDVINDLRDVGVISLGLKGYKRANPAHYQTYSGILHRNLGEKLERGGLDGPVILFNDEFHVLSPNRASSRVKQPFQDILQITGRQAEIATVIASQRPSEIPNPRNSDDFDFLSPLTHALLMRGKSQLSPEDWKPVVEGLGVYSGTGDAELNAWKRKINGLSRYEGVFIDSLRHDGPGDCPVVESLAPLCSHPG